MHDITRELGHNHIHVLKVGGDSKMIVLRVCSYLLFMQIDIDGGELSTLPTLFTSNPDLQIDQVGRYLP